MTPSTDFHPMAGTWRRRIREQRSNPDRRLRVYLNDHMAGAVAGVALTRRIASENEGSPLGAFAKSLADEIGQDREALQKIARSLGIPENRIKQLLAWIGERTGRMKMNGSLLEYSPQSRLFELEALSLGIEGKRLLWHSLITRAEADRRLDEPQLQALASRAEDQRIELERFRIDAARDSLTL